MDNGDTTSDFVPSQQPKKRRRIEGRSAYLKVKRDLENVYVEDFDNPWTLAVTFLRPEREYLQWLMDRGFLRWEVYCNTGKCNNARCKLQVSHSYLPPTIVYLSHISHNALLAYENRHDFVTQMCTCLHIDFIKCGIVGDMWDALWDLWCLLVQSYGKFPQVTAVAIASCVV